MALRWASVRPTNDPHATTALVHAASAARRFWISSRAFCDSVVSVQAYDRIFRRALYRIERRRVVRKIAPYLGTPPQVPSPLPDPARHDPWSTDPDQLERASRVVSVCPVCDGSRLARCDHCDGTGRRDCLRCTYVTLGHARPDRHCPDCHGVGSSVCRSCWLGRRHCPTCAATGRVLAWLTVDQVTIRTTVVYPSDAKSILPVVLPETNYFTPTGDIHLSPPHTLLDDTGMHSLDRVCTAALVLQDTAQSVHRRMYPLPFELPPELLPDLDGRIDRIAGVQVQTFRTRAHRVVYRTAFCDGQLDVVGHRIFACHQDWRPLRTRRRLLAATFSILACLAFLLFSHYEHQHLFHVRYGHGGWLLTSAILTALLATVTVAGFLLPSQARTFPRTWLPLVSAVSMAFMTALVWQHGSPRLASARQALQAGDWERATLEAEALEANGIDRPGAIALLAEIEWQRQRLLAERSRPPR